MWKWLGAVVIAAATAGGACWYATRTSPADHYRRGLTALTAGHLSQVADAAQALSSSTGYQSHVHLLQGAYLLRRGKPQESLDELRQALNHDDTRVRAQILAGEALATLHQSLRATDVLRQALAAESENVDAHRWAGAAYYDLGAMAQAVHHLERVCSLDPADPRPARVMGLIYKDLENDQLAVKWYRECLDRSSSQPDVEAIRCELAEVLIRLNRHEEARTTLSTCEVSPQVLALRAECEHALGDTVRAKTLLSTSLRMSPSEPLALLLKGTIALGENQPQAAVAAFQQVVDQNPTDFTARFKLSQALAQSGDDARAARELAEMNAIKDIRQDAAKVYEKVLDDPHDADSRFRLGVLSERLHKPELAQMWYQAALAINPKHGPSRAALDGLGGAATGKNPTGKVSERPE
jgi:tetratricopeptide (TPR) repeat protein